MEEFGLEKIANKLEELVVKNKKNKKLNNPEKKLAHEYVVELIMHEDWLEKSLQYLLNLPVELCSSVLETAWTNLPDFQKKLLLKVITESKEYNSPAGHNRQIEVIRVLSSLRDKDALTLLVSLSNKITSGGTRIPANATIKKFKQALIDPGFLLKLTLSDQNSPDEIGYIAINILLGFSDQYPIEDKSVRQNTIELEIGHLLWLMSSEKPISIQPKILKEITKNLIDWPEEIQRHCFEMGLIKEIRLRAPFDSSNKTETTTSIPVQKNEFINREVHQTENNASDAKETLSINASNNESIVKQEYKPTYSQQFKSQAGSFPNRDNILIQLENVTFAVRKLVDEQKNTMLTIQNLENIIRIKEKTVTDLKNQLIKKEYEINQSKEAESNAARKMKDLEIHIQSLKQMMAEKEQLAKDTEAAFVRNIESGIDQKAEQLKNRVKGALRTDYRQVMQVQDAEMTIELGDALRAIVFNIFSVLEREKISFE